MYNEYLTKGILPYEKKDVAKVKRKAKRFHMFEGKLYRHGFNGKPVRCLSQGKAPDLLFQMHQEKHQ